MQITRRFFFDSILFQIKIYGCPMFVRGCPMLVRTKNYFCAESRVANQLSTATLPPPDNIKDTLAANSANPNS